METWQKFDLCIIGMGMILAFILYMCSCSTVSINVVQSEGKTTDLIDGAQTTTPTVSTDLDIPIP